MNLKEKFNKHSLRSHAGLWLMLVAILAMESIACVQYFYTRATIKADAFIPYDEDKADSDDKALPDSREGMLFYMTLYIGRGEFLWADMDQAERWLKRQLEEQHTENPLDYLHASHLALHEGDKEKAMDYYRQAFDLSTNKPFLHDMFRFEKREMVRMYDFDESALNEVEEQIKDL